MWRRFDSGYRTDLRGHGILQLKKKIFALRVNYASSLQALEFTRVWTPAPGTTQHCSKLHFSASSYLKSKA
jgi:hypothetical protein